MNPFALAQRFRNSLKNEGLTATARKCLRVPGRQLSHWRQRYHRWKFGNSQDPQVIFEMAYKLNFWDNPESVSGPGSTLAYTANLRHHLPLIFREFSIQTVFDAPCGDFNWMRHVVSATSIRYIGGDIVPAIVKANQAAHGSGRANFVTFDIMRGQFPAADLWICRDCLFHLSYRQIYAALRNFAASPVRYILVTNHARRVVFENRDIRTGDCRMLDLSAPPFNLPAEVKYRIEEGSYLASGHEMCLWERSQVASALPAFARALGIDATGPTS